MRLLPHEIVALRAAVREVFGLTARIRLFGSGVRDDLKGGDVDLFVEVEDFLAGSGTTAHAVLDLSRQDGGPRFMTKGVTSFRTV